MHEKYAATLIRGTSYTVANRSGGDDFVFLRDVSTVINERLRENLEAVVDDVVGGTDHDTGEVEILVKPCFRIEPYDGERLVGATVLPIEPVKTRRIRKVA